MLRLPTEHYVKKEFNHCFDVTAIHKIVSAEDDCLEADVRSTSSSMDATDSHKVL
jgi:hypothetical protein